MGETVVGGWWWSVVVEVEVGGWWTVVGGWRWWRGGGGVLQQWVAGISSFVPDSPAGLFRLDPFVLPGGLRLRLRGV